MGHAQLPSAATDLILLGDLTGRYATGSYSRLASDGRTLVLRGDRKGAAEHGHRITAAIACHVARAGGSLNQLATHEEAKAAARVTLYSAARSRGRTVFFEDVRLAALLTSDPERAQNFVRDELGALGHPREALLRETVRVYLECNCSPATAAARLDVVKNTVVYRIRRAEEMLGRSVKEQQGILWAALHLVDVVDPVESQYSA